MPVFDTWERETDMTEKRDNYQIQLMQAKKRFLTYDQQELINRCAVGFDEDYFYINEQMKDIGTSLKE